MDTDQVRTKLLMARRTPVYLTGDKLTESANHLKQARLLALGWAREAYLSSDNADQHLDHIMEVLDLSERMEGLRLKFAAKGSVFGVSK